MTISTGAGILSVDTDKCTGCGICAEICPLNVITCEDGAVGQSEDTLSGLLKAMFNTQNALYCLGCGHCVSICPHDALSHALSPLEKSPIVQRDLLPEYKQVEHLLKSRRSVRVYADQPVDRSLLRQLIETAAYAPTGANAQGVEWIIADDESTLSRVRSLVIEWMEGLIKENSELLNIAPIHKTLEGIALGRDPILRQAPVLLVARAGTDIPFREQDVNIALSNLEIAAWAAGLGTTWLAMVARVIQAYPPLRTFLGIREDDYYYSMLIGYPKYRFRRIPLRNVRQISYIQP